jgi:uncharacterized protein YndB with AHSA1/START domain
LPDHLLSVVIRTPRQRVWEELTSLGRVQRWMNNTVLDTALRPGAKLRYYSPNRKRVFVVGEILAIDPPRKLSHTFVFTFRPERPTIVTWDLEEVPEGCRVTLTHGGFTDQAATHKGVVGGWREILDLLRVTLETGDVPLGLKIR